MLAIKQTLYRTSGDSPIVDALIDAAEAGKQVAGGRRDQGALRRAAPTSLGPQARAGRLPRRLRRGRAEDALQARAGRPPGAHGELRRYCHIGTGNYNPKTARLYEDFGLLTADPLVGEDVTDLFNHLTGYSSHSAYSGCWSRRTRCAAGCWPDRPGDRPPRRRDARPASGSRTNSLVDEPIIDALYRASPAGVPVDLWVRGMCTLRPGIPGLSREHPRTVACSAASWSTPGCTSSAWAGGPRCGSAARDLMRRNLDRRVEALVKVTSTSTRRT